MRRTGIIHDFIIFRRDKRDEQLANWLALRTAYWPVKAQLVASGAFALLCNGCFGAVAAFGSEYFISCHVWNDCDSADLEGIWVIPLVFVLFAVFRLSVFASTYRPNIQLIVEKFYQEGIIVLWIVLTLLVMLALGVCVSLGLRLF